MGLCLARLPRGVWIAAAGVLIGCTAARPPVATQSILASRPADAALAAIRDEGFNHSKIAETADYLCNVIGPRLTGSPALCRANEWTRDTLAGWGLADAHLEPWGTLGRGWTLRRFSFGVTTPYAFTVAACPDAWSPGFDRPLDAEVVYLDTKSEAGLAAYQDRLAGRIVLIGSARMPASAFEPTATRLSDERLAAMAAVGPPARELLRPATSPAKSSTTAISADLGAQAFSAKALAFAAAHGAACVVTPSAGGDDGSIFVAGATVPGPATRPRAWDADTPPIPAQITASIESFGRLVSLIRHGQAVRATIDLGVAVAAAAPPQANTIADIPGTDRAGEIVMLGAHLDSWHGGTGATDNAAGVVAAMEAVRLIAATGLRPRRTIRIGLWTGEEQGLVGSIAYVKAHFGHLAGDPSAFAPATTRPAAIVRGPGYDRLGVYFNLDAGTGKIRGLYAQNNAAAVPLFAAWLAPLRDLGATTVSPTDFYGSDHVAFARVGLPGFEFIQDPIDYFTVTHHSTADTFGHLWIDDLKQAAVVMATVLWDAANADEPFPRKPVGP